MEPDGQMQKDTNDVYRNVFRKVELRREKDRLSIFSIVNRVTLTLLYSGAFFNTCFAVYEMAKHNDRNALSVALAAAAGFLGSGLAGTMQGIYDKRSEEIREELKGLEAKVE